MADFVATVVQEDGRIARERIAKYGIACDLKDGNIFTAFTAAQMSGLEAKRTLWRRSGHDHHLPQPAEQPLHASRRLRCHRRQL